MQFMQKLLMGYVAFSHTISLKLRCILQEQHISVPTGPVLGAQYPDVVRKFHTVQGAALQTAPHQSPRQAGVSLWTVPHQSPRQAGVSESTLCPPAFADVVLPARNFLPVHTSCHPGELTLQDHLIQHSLWEIFSKVTRAELHVCFFVLSFFPSFSLPFFLPSSQGVGLTEVTQYTCTYIYTVITYSHYK